MPTVLAVMAHPDDIELLCAGTLALLKRAGWEVATGTMTAGDKGSATLSRAEIARIRTGEARASAALLGASYACLGFEDLGIAYGLEPKRIVTALLREVAPDLVITHARADYMADHEETTKLVREAAFASTVPNFDVGRPLPLPKKLPVILYADPSMNLDHLGRRVSAARTVDITDVIDLKERMLACHESQRAWLRQQHGTDDYLTSMRRRSADRAQDFGDPRVAFAEGFDQHLGPPFPKRDVLVEALGPARVRVA